MLEAARPAPLRLLFVTSLPRWGGRERWILQAASGLAARGHDVQVVARPGSKILARAAEAGLGTRAVRTERALDPRTLLAMRRILTTQRPQAVFVQLDRELVEVALASWGGTPPPVFQKRGPRRGPHVALKRAFLAKRVTRTLTSTEHVRAALEAHAGLRSDEALVVHDGVAVDTGPPRSERDALRQQLKLPQARPLVLHVGMLETGKGQETTLRALAALRASRPGTVPTVAFLGTGPEEAHLHDLCQKLGLREHVVWVGFRTNVSGYLAAADVLVLPAASENLSWTILEAMAQRLPVIASDVPVHREILHGDNALLVPPGDPAALARAVASVLDDAALAAARAKRGWETVCDDWNLEAMLDDLECLVYAQLLRRHRTGPQAALFVDRDDTLIRDVPYSGDPDSVQLLPGAARALRWVREAGLPIVMVSNQSGVAQGRVSEDEVRAVNSRVDALLRASGAGLDGIYWCPHHPEHSGECDCRKPEPGLLRRAARELGIDLGQSLTVGNAARDLEAGRRAGTAVAGYAGSGVDSDLPATAPVYYSWTRLVRDFLRHSFSMKTASS